MSKFLCAIFALFLSLIFQIGESNAETIEKCSEGSPFPQAREGVHYQSGWAFALAPAPADGWTMARCSTDRIYWAKQEPNGEVSTAAAAIPGVKPYLNDEQFLAEVRSTAQSIGSSGFDIKSIDVQKLQNTSTPCAIAEIRGEPPSALKERGLLTAIGFVQLCYQGEIPNMGVMATYLHIGNASVKTTRAEALAFFKGVTWREPQ